MQNVSRSPESPLHVACSKIDEENETIKLKTSNKMQSGHRMFKTADSHLQISPNTSFFRGSISVHFAVNGHGKYVSELSVL